MSNVPPVIITSSLKQTASIIFLHGLGDTGHGWTNAVAAVRPPYMKVICPTASVIPVSLNSGFQMTAWFDIRGLEETAPEDTEGILNATNYVHSLIDKEIKDGIPSERVVVAGFSQGGALALYSALTYPKKLAGIIGLSCWLPLHKQLAQSNITANRNIPILQCHGDCDPIISIKFGQLSASALKQYTNNLEFKTYKELSHSSSEEELNDVRNFLKTKVPPV